MNTLARPRRASVTETKRNGAAGHIAAPSLFTWRRIRRLELHRYAAVDGRFGAGVGALTGCCDRADAGGRVVIETELVLPVAIGNPEVDEVRGFRADEGLAGVKRQTDRFAVELGLGRGAEAADTKSGERLVLIALRSIPGGAAADRPELHVLWQEAQIHVVVGLNCPGRIVLGVAVRKAGYAGDAGTKQAALVKCVVVGELPVSQGRHVEVALVGQVEGELQTGNHVALGGSQEGVFRVGVHADFERNVVQRPYAEGLGVEDFVEAEGGAEQAVVSVPTTPLTLNPQDGSPILARRGGGVMTRRRHPAR